MKLYTRPRPIMAGQTRIGDQLATTPEGEFIQSEAEYMDLDLRDAEGISVGWTVVHNSTINTTPDEYAKGRDWVLVHSHGVEAVPALSFVIMREVIEVDPWSYIKH